MATQSEIAEDMGAQAPSQQALVYTLGAEQRLTRVESDVANEQDWRRDIVKRLDRIEGKVDTNFKWLIGITIGATIGVIGTVITAAAFIVSALG